MAHGWWKDQVGIKTWKKVRNASRESGTRRVVVVVVVVVGIWVGMIEHRRRESAVNGTHGREPDAAHLPYLEECMPSQLLGA